MKKHIPPFLLAAWPYIFFALCWPLEWLLSELPQQDTAAEDLILTVGSAVFGISLLLLLVGNVISALRGKHLTAAELARWDLIIKLCHIPVYVVVFLFSLLALISIAVPAVLMMVVTLIPGMFFFDLVLMLTSSCYGFRALRMAKQEGIVDKKWARRHTIAHCFFVADVISAFLIRRKLR